MEAVERCHRAVRRHLKHRAIAVIANVESCPVEVARLVEDRSDICWSTAVCTREAMEHRLDVALPALRDLVNCSVVVRPAAQCHSIEAAGLVKSHSTPRK